MTKIFISYRRDDSRETTERLHDQMIIHFGEENVFQDVDNIPIGVNFRRYLQDEIAKCDVVLVVIGPDWGRIMQERAQQNNDFVRIEVESALKLGKFVVPVTVKEAKMPDMSQLPDSIHELGELNAANLRFNPHFKQDCQRLAEAVKQELARRQESLTPQPPLPHETRGSKEPTAPFEAFEVDSDADFTPDSNGEFDDPFAWLEELDDSDVIEQPPIPLKPYSVREALTRAHNFIYEGKKNSDWTPFYVTFSDVKIPDMRFCLVPTGKFMMGSDDKKWDDEEPVHEQTFNQPFYIAPYPVTNAQWALGVMMGAVGEPEGEKAVKWYRDPQMANAPVVGMSWFDCQKFAKWAGCRLATEREWEYAARGIESMRYPWGNDWDADSVVWIENSGGKPSDVMTKPDGASWVGALHMSGNVWEWTASLYEPYPYVSDGSREREGDGKRVLRGGAWGYSTVDDLRLACRNKFRPDLRLSYWHNYRGLRLALS